MSLAMRYMVDDVSQAIAFYRDLLGFTLVQRFGPAMAILEHGGVRLWLAGPAASARRPMPDGALPAPGGWNRIVLPVADLPAAAARLRAAGVAFRGDIVSGPGGSQVLVQDPSGNPVELFQAAPAPG